MCRNMREVPASTLTVADFDSMGDAIDKLELVVVAAEQANTYGEGACGGLSLIVGEVLEDVRRFVTKVNSEWKSQ